MCPSRLSPSLNVEQEETVGDLFLKTRAGRWRGAEAPPSNIRSASATPHARDVAFGQVVRDLDTCPGPARRFSRTRPEAHVGR
jgi:hypothetical protein